MQTPQMNQRQLFTIMLFHLVFSLTFVAMGIWWSCYHQAIHILLHIQWRYGSRQALLEHGRLRCNLARGLWCSQGLVRHVGVLCNGRYIRWFLGKRYWFHTVPVCFFPDDWSQHLIGLKRAERTSVMTRRSKVVALQMSIKWRSLSKQQPGLSKIGLLQGMF